MLRSAPAVWLASALAQLHINVPLLQQELRHSIANFHDVDRAACMVHMCSSQVAEALCSHGFPLHPCLCSYSHLQHRLPCRQDICLANPPKSGCGHPAASQPPLQLQPEPFHHQHWLLPAGQPLSISRGSCQSAREWLELSCRHPYRHGPAAVHACLHLAGALRATSERACPARWASLEACQGTSPLLSLPFA